MSRASGAGCVLVLVPRVGDFVPQRATLFEVHGHAPALGDVGLAGRVAFDTERNFEQDVAFGFRELVDIAERALSPAMNDPTTAVQALDVLHDLLRRLAGRPTPSGRLTDAAGELRLVVGVYSFADLLTFSLDEIERYGADSAQIPARLHAMLTDLLQVALPTYQQLISTRLQLLGDNE